jgi:hypothetical protein
MPRGAADDGPNCVAADRRAGAGRVARAPEGGTVDGGEARTETRARAGEEGAGARRGSGAAGASKKVQTVWWRRTTASRRRAYADAHAPKGGRGRRRSLRGRESGARGQCPRAHERWRHDATSDKRRGPSRRLADTLTAAERVALLATVNSAPFGDLSPHQIIPRLADAGAVGRHGVDEEPCAACGPAAGPSRPSGGTTAAGNAVARGDGAEPSADLDHHVPRQSRARRVLVPVCDPRGLKSADRGLDRRGHGE